MAKSKITFPGGLCLNRHCKLFERFTLKDQGNRSSGSIMDNIAEGFGRKGTFEFIDFLTYSYASCCECGSQIYRAYDRKYVTEEKRNELFTLSGEIAKMINFIKYLGKTKFKGSKFKGRKPTKN